MLSSWSMSITVICGCHSARIASASAKVVRSSNDEETVVERQLDEVHDQLTIVENERPVRLDSRCLHMDVCHGSSP